MPPITVESFKDITNAFARLIVETSERKFIDGTFNVCKWFSQQRINYMKTMFEKYFDASVKKCPWKKGNYSVAGVRTYNTDVTDYIPSFIPVKGNVTLKIKANTRVGNRIISLGNLTEVYEFC